VDKEAEAAEDDGHDVAEQFGLSLLKGLYQHFFVVVLAIVAESLD
jgi:hypothetical protein